MRRRRTKRVSLDVLADSEAGSANGSTSFPPAQPVVSLGMLPPSSEDSSETDGASPRKSKQPSTNGSSKAPPPARRLSKVSFPRLSITLLVQTLESERAEGTITVSGRIIGDSTVD